MGERNGVWRAPFIFKGSILEKAEEEKQEEQSDSGSLGIRIPSEPESDCFSCFSSSTCSRIEPLKINGARHTPFLSPSKQCQISAALTSVRSNHPLPLSFLDPLPVYCGK